MNTNRVETSKKLFRQLFHDSPQIITSAPGRAEILGCHTDYNNGFALAAAIPQNTLCLLSQRSDNFIAAYSAAFSESGLVKFQQQQIKRDLKNSWTNYIRAIVQQLLQIGCSLQGANILIDSTVPKSGGVSSSAALEMAVALGLTTLHQYPLNPLELAFICKTAENSDLVKSPCGFLDQATVAFAQKDALVFMDFLPTNFSPVSEIKIIPFSLSDTARFIITVDPMIERQLGTSGYAQRRQTCQSSLPFWSTVLKKDVTSLRDVSLADFLKHRDSLEQKSSIMRKRVQHVVKENQRVFDAVQALRGNDIINFGKLLTESGNSALRLYDLDENTPGLTFLVKTAKKLPGVLGIRNMGGGFSAITLALIKTNCLSDYKDRLSILYDQKYKHPLTFIEFSPSTGANIELCLPQLP